MQSINYGEKKEIYGELKIATIHYHIVLMFVCTLWTEPVPEYAGS